jgi:hypothetical protein
MGMIRTNIFLPERQLFELRVLANATGLSVAELVRRAIDQYLRKKK